MNIFIGLDKNSSIPIYAQIEKFLKDSIISGEISSHDRVPSEMELARKNNVSPMTVRHAYNRLVADGFIYRHQGKGTFVSQPPNDFAKVKSSPKKSIDIGILVNSYKNIVLFSSKIILGIEEACIDNAIKMYMMPTYGEDLRSPQNNGLWDLVKSGHLDGMIVMGTVSRMETEKLLEFHLPCIVIDNDYIDKKIPAILTDDIKFAKLAIGKLIKKGIGDIAILTSPKAEKGSNLQRRSDKILATYKEELQKASIPIKKNLIKICELSHEAGNQATRELLLLKKRPGAVIITGDFLVDSFMKTAAELNVSLPDDIIPVNFGDSPESAFAHISMPLFQMGKRAVIELKRIINNNAVTEKQITLPVNVHWQKPLI
jgi:GntR family transcriptional regulator, arabinose operon transcriptional repressor